MRLIPALRSLQQARTLFILITLLVASGPAFAAGPTIINPGFEDDGGSFEDFGAARVDLDQSAFARSDPRRPNIADRPSKGAGEPRRTGDLAYVIRACRLG